MRNHQSIVAQKVKEIVSHVIYWSGCTAGAIQLVLWPVKGRLGRIVLCTTQVPGLTQPPDKTTFNCTARMV